jgi:plastocyanin
MRARFPLILCLFAACGGGGDGGGPTSPGGNNNPGGSDAPLQASINMKTDPIDSYGYGGASSFDPTLTTIRRGGTVTWNNSSGTAHNVTFDTSGSPGNVSDMSTGSASRTFNGAGAFYYHCSNHSGMSGTIVVQ